MKLEIAGGTLELIDLPQPLPGQDKFIGCWLYRDDARAFIVDTGPGGSAPYLIEALRARGVRRLDNILLTHVHIDHAGGVGIVAQAFSEADVICHPKGIRHLVEPGRLWEASEKVLGCAAPVYGRPEPLAEDRCAGTDVPVSTGIEVIRTPGHASHHLSFRFGDVLFVGEAAGTFADLPEGPYLRPATPPRFFLEQALDSHDKLLALDPLPQYLAFAHRGLAVGRTRELLEGARDQHLLWVETTRQVMAAGRGDLPTQARLVHETLLKEDSYYARFLCFDEAAQERELSFMEQTLVGIAGYLSQGSPDGGAPSLIDELRRPDRFGD